MSLQSLIDSKLILIFDFDGVLVDSVEVKTDAFAALYIKYGKNIVEKVIKHHRLNGGMSRYEKFKYYHQYFLNRKITKDEINVLNQKFSNLVVSKVVNSPEIEGVSDFLNKYNVKKLFFVNSATPTNEIKKIIILRGWSHYFNGIFGSPNDKIKNIANILNKTQINHDEKIKSSVFFGDARSDYLAATATGIDFVFLNQSNVFFEEKENIKYIINNFIPLV